MLLSVITPTYNRAQLLWRLYASLVAQTDRDLEWIVIDDGSSDETEKTVLSMINEGIIPIKYKKITHAGKPTAHNEGVMLAQGVLTVCVDSDDALTTDAISAVRSMLEVADASDIGIIAPRIDFSEGRMLCTPMPKIKRCDFSTLTDKYSLTGDTALFFRTEVLRENLFPLFTGEDFIPEDALYISLDRLGKMLILSRGIYICEYQPDGLSANYRTLLRKNPMGTAYSYCIKSNAARRFKLKLRYAIISQSYLKLSKRKKEYDVSIRAFYRLLANALRPIYMRKKGLK